MSIMTRSMVGGVQSLEGRREIDQILYPNVLDRGVRLRRMMRLMISSFHK